MSLFFSPGFGAAIAPSNATAPPAVGVLLNPGDSLIQYVNASGDRVARLQSLAVSAIPNAPLVGTPTIMLPVWIAVCPAPQAASMQVPQPVPLVMLQNLVGPAFAGPGIWPQVANLRQAKADLKFANFAPAFPSGEYRWAEHEIVAVPTQQIVIVVAAPWDVTAGQPLTGAAFVYLNSLGWDESILEGVSFNEIASMARFATPRVPGFELPTPSGVGG